MCLIIVGYNNSSIEELWIGMMTMHMYSVFALIFEERDSIKIAFVFAFGGNKSFFVICCYYFNDKDVVVIKIERPLCLLNLEKAFHNLPFVIQASTKSIVKCTRTYLEI